jgi:hypothetical protein
MKDFSKYKEIGKTRNSVIHVLDSDSDIIIVVPFIGTKDNVKDASEIAAFMYAYMQELGKPVGSIIMMDNMLSQDAETRRVYAEIDPTRVYGAALVVQSALSRALGSFFLGLSRPLSPTRLFDTIENATVWLRTIRPQ